MTTQRLGVIMNGVTGRMGLNQHLIRSIIAIRDQGGVKLANGDRVMPDPILVGRDARKVEALAKRFAVERWTTDLDAALSDKKDAVFFDAATTQARPGLLTRAFNAGKHVYCEKPTATNLEEAVAIVKLGNSKGLKHGVKLRGHRKLRSRAPQLDDLAAHGERREEVRPLQRLSLIR